MANDPQYDITDTTKNAKLLNEARPKSSRLIKEDGTVINFADAITTDGEGNLALRAVASS